MSQISNDHGINLNHYQEAALEPKVSGNDIPAELKGARPASSSSSMSIAGRVAVGIVTIGLSELFRLAYRGIKALINSCRPAPHREPRIPQNSAGVPKAVPNDNKFNSDLAAAVTGKKPWPEEYKTAIDQALNDLRGQYGDKYIPQGATINDLLDKINQDIEGYAKRDFYMAFKNAANALSPDDVKNIIREVYVPALNSTILGKLAEEKASQLGGLGGINTSKIMSNLITSEVKNELQAISSEADVQKLAEKMKLGQIMAGYRSAMDNTLGELRTIYGANSLPLGLNEALALRSNTGQTLQKIMEDRFHSRSTITPEKLAAILKEELEPILQHNAVEKALSEKAQQMGVPLSRRSAVLLANSLLEIPQNEAALKGIKSPANLKASIEAMGLEALLEAQKAGLEMAYASHAQKLAPELRPIFRTFLEGCSFAPSSAASTNEAILKQVERMKNWKNFDGSEELRMPLNDNFKETFAQDLKMLEGVPGNTDSTGFKDNIYKTLYDDAHRNDFTINDVQFSRIPGKTQDELITNLKTTLPNARDQQFISKLINQRMWGNVHVTSGRGMLDNGTLLQDLPGATSLPAVSPGEPPILADYNHHPATFTIQIAPDKKTAQVTSTSVQKILYPDNQAVDGKVPHYAGIRFTFSFQLTLSAHEQGQSVVDVKLGQEFINRSDLDRI